MAKMLYGWNDGKFEKEYLRETGENRSQFLLQRNIKERSNIRIKNSGLNFF